MPENDPYCKIADDALKVIVTAGVPGKFLVDIFPLCNKFILSISLNFTDAMNSKVRPCLDAWGRISAAGIGVEKAHNGNGRETICGIKETICGPYSYFPVECADVAIG